MKICAEAVSTVRVEMHTSMVTSDAMAVNKMNVLGRRPAHRLGIFSDEIFFALVRTSGRRFCPHHNHVLSSADRNQAFLQKWEPPKCK